MIHDSYDQELDVGSIVGYSRGGSSASSKTYIAEVTEIVEEYDFGPGSLKNAGRIKINLKYSMPMKVPVTLKPVIVDSRSVVLLPAGV